jgi:two-component system cell cycle response regulator CtrA
MVRRSHGFSQKLIRSGCLELNQDEQKVTVHGMGVVLTPKEYIILELLMLRNGKPVTKSSILNHLYGGRDEPSSRTIDVFVCILRHKLASAGAPQVIRTLPKIGYALIRQDDEVSGAVTPPIGLGAVKPTDEGIAFRTNAALACAAP